VRSHYCTEVSESDIGKEVTLCGWTNSYRDHGGVIFIDLRDKSGLIQLVCDPADNCPFAANSDQVDTDLDGVGNACQCGDVNGDGRVNILDAYMVAVLSHSDSPRHGKPSPVRHDGKGVLRGIKNPLIAGRYHSLAVLEVPQEFEVSAVSLDDSVIMGIRHRKLPIEGLQFHPESVLTEWERKEGVKIIKNFVEMAKDGGVR